MKLNKKTFMIAGAAAMLTTEQPFLFCSNQRLGNGRGQLVLLGCSGKQGDQCVEKIRK